ncbi:MAG: GtrA family protein [Dactylosporangium sp.]|nr:GtrA family protein [Dactylosporangium sp.]NNJ62091.1 GtrA family protein [Dactylosporangium sp.]
MRLLRILPERWQSLFKELTSFAIIGVINTAVDFIILNALLWMGPLKAKVIATVVATSMSYVMNRYWTFAKRERTSAHKEYALFFALNLVGMAIQLAVLGGAKYGLGFSENGDLGDRIAFNVANALGTIIAMVFRFWSYRTFVFRAAPVVATPTASAVAPDEGTALVPGPRTAASTATTDDEFAELTTHLEFDEPALEDASATPSHAPRE